MRFVLPAHVPPNSSSHGIGATRVKCGEHAFVLAWVLADWKAEHDEMVQENKTCARDGRSLPCHRPFNFWLQRTFLQQHLGEMHVLVARTNDKRLVPVGLLWIRGMIEPRTDVCIEFLWIHREYRSRGFATSVINVDVPRWIRQTRRGACRLVLEAVENNETFWQEHCGFARIQLDEPDAHFFSIQMFRDL